MMFANAAQNQLLFLKNETRVDPKISANFNEFFKSKTFES